MVGITPPQRFMTQNARSPLIFVTLAAVVFGGGLLIAEQAPPGRIPHPARDLPGLLPDTCALRLVVDGGPCVERSGDLALADLLAEPEVRTFMAPIRASAMGWLRQFDPQVQEYLGISVDEALQLLKNRIGVALCGLNPPLEPGGPPVPDAVLTLEFEDDIEMVRRLMHALEVAVLAWGDGRFTDDTVAGLPVRRYVPDPKRPGTPPAWYLLDDRMLLLATDRDTLEGVITRMKSGGRANSLAGSETFSVVQRQVVGADSIVEVYADLKRLRAMMEPMTGAEVWKPLELFAVDQIKAVGYGLALDGKGLRDRAFGKLDDGPLRRAFEGAPAPNAHQVVPASTGFLATTNVDLGLLWGHAQDVIARMEPSAHGQLQDALAAAADRMGASVEGDILPKLGPEVSLAAWWPQRALYPDLGLLIQLQDAEAFERLLASSLRSLDVPTSIQEHRGFAIASLDMGELTADLELPQRPSWTIVDGRLLVTLWPQAAKNFIDQVSDDAPSLGADPTFVSVLSRLSGPDGDAGRSGLVWLDVRGAAEALCDNAVPLAQSLLPPGEEVQLDWAAFPHTATVTEHLFGLVGTTRWIEEGVRVDYYSPTGYAGPYVVAVGLAAWVLLASEQVEQAREGEAMRARALEGVIPFEELPPVETKPKTQGGKGKKKEDK